MGIVNVTPDSFSDGGLFCSVGAAVARALEMTACGAHIIDVGGVSTRPSSLPVDAASEWARVCPTLRALRTQLPDSVLLSLDSGTPEVALKAAQEGLVDILNDVAAGQNFDSKAGTTCDIAGRFELGLVLMHMQGTPATMQTNPTYDDCVSEVVSFLELAMARALACGVRALAIDPGIGFGKSLEHNLELLSESGLQKLVGLGPPVLVGLSRKRFLAEEAVQLSLPEPLTEPQSRDAASKNWERICLNRGVRIIRSHKMPIEVTKTDNQC